MKRAAWVLLAALLGNAHAAERVAVPSLDRVDGAAVSLVGFWFAAPGAGKAPAVILLHGCSGPYDARGNLGERMQEYAARINGLGAHALVLDSLSARGVKTLCVLREGARPVTQLHRRRDTLGAMEWLAARADVDASRLGLLGWSHGGSTVLASTNLRHTEVAVSALRPRFAAAFYPGCGLELQRGYDASAPLLMLVGDADDWTPAVPCQLLSRQAQGAKVAIETYAGAHHGFDSTQPVRHRADVPGGVNPGKGVHVGGDPTARAASLARLDDFVRTHLR